MRNDHILYAILLILLCSRCTTGSSKTQETASAIEESLYFGQKPPGLVPQVFAPGVISMNGRFESTVSFSPDLKELYFEAKREGEASQIFYSKLRGATWTPIERADFTKGNKREEMHPFVNPEGTRIYFTAFDSIFSDERIWYVNRSENTWSEAIKLESAMNDDKVFFANHGKNKELYYFSLADFKTYTATYKNGSFVDPIEVAIEQGHHAFVSPDDEYLLVAARNSEVEDRKDNDIYVYFKSKDGTWSAPINLGPEVNSSFSEKAPTITPDGKYLFFGRDERAIEPGLSDIYWVSTKVIENLRP